MPTLFRRREVVLPTLWGLLLLATLLALLAWAAALAAQPFFAINEPVKGANGRGARVLVIEGWVGEPELDQALALIRKGQYERVITAGGPIPSFSPFANFAERAADYLRRKGLVDLPLDAVPSPRSLQDRTYLSALKVREWADAAKVPLDTVDVFTYDMHARRTRLLYRMALGNSSSVGVLAAYPTDLDSRRWWTNSYSLKILIGEVLSLAWTKCCYWPPAAPSEPGEGPPAPLAY